MLLRELTNNINQAKATAVLGWGRGMGHKGHMLLAQAVIHHAEQINAEPFFVVSRTTLIDPDTGDVWADRKKVNTSKDDPLTPDEKIATYKKVFPDQSHIFSVATEDASTLLQVIAKLSRQGFKNIVLVVGEKEVAGFSYLSNPDKSGTSPMQQVGVDTLKIISRQETNAPGSDVSKPDYQEGPRATPLRQVLLDPNKSQEEQFAIWRDAMPDKLSDEEVMDLMQKAKDRLVKANTPVVRGKKGVAEGLLGLLSKAPIAKTTSVSKVPGPLKPGEMPPDIKMLINKIQNKVPLRSDEYSKLQAYKAFKDADSMSLKEANILARALREGSAGKVGKGGTKPIDKEKKAAMRNATTVPGLNMSTGSMYKNYRMSVALAGAPDYPTKMEADNWIGGDPLISSYTQEEYDMVKAAAKQVGAGTIENWTGKRSEEMANVNKTSTVAKPKKNKYGV